MSGQMPKKGNIKQRFSIAGLETEKVLDFETIAEALSQTEEEAETERFRMMEAGVGAEFTRIFGVKKGKA